MSLLTSFEKLKAFISELTAVPPVEWAFFIRNLRLVHLKKGEHLFNEGDSTQMIGYVTRGLIHTYYLTEDGRHKTKNFAWEGRLISPYANVLQNKPANFTAEALEPSLIVTFDGEVLREMQNRHVCWERMSRRCAELILIERERREYEFLVMGYEKRIESFYDYYRPIVNRIPQYLIASYLGITPVALSRILAARLKK